MPIPTLPLRPSKRAPVDEWTAYREALCLAARQLEPLTWPLVERLTDGFTMMAPLPTRAEWDALLAALRANPGWDETAAVGYIAHLVVSSSEDGVRTGLAGVGRWSGIGRLLADTPAFAERARIDAALQSVLWHLAAPAMDALKGTRGTDVAGLAPWPRFAVLLLARAGTEAPETIRRWRQQLTRYAQPLAAAEHRFAQEERTRLVIPPEASVAATLVCQELPRDFAEAISDVLRRQPLVAVLALVRATAAQCAAVNPEVLAKVLSLPDLVPRRRVDLTTAASRWAPGTVQARAR